MSPVHILSQLLKQCLSSVCGGRTSQARFGRQFHPARYDATLFTSGKSPQSQINARPNERFPQISRSKYPILELNLVHESPDSSAYSVRLVIRVAGGRNPLNTTWP
ncbi:hypothetical protein LZ554_000466 [Drepanopeziza brunnea f. sp. 'monogermtubi']|nr:hypothetical protein LZ554_000466 [Drepanopeziza brunnea f. sp. 'monogermtubi']